MPLVTLAYSTIIKVIISIIIIIYEYVAPTFVKVNKVGVICVIVVSIGLGASDNIVAIGSLVYRHDCGLNCVKFNDASSVLISLFK